MYKKGLAALSALCLTLLLTVLPFVSCCPAPDTGTQTYTVGMLNFPNTTNPFNTTIGEADASHYGLIYEPLVWGWASGGKFAGLAESWEYDADTMTWTMVIYDDAEWADGEPVTATDVKFTYDTYNDLGHGVLDTLGPALDEINVVDDKTVEFVLNQVLALFLTEVQSVMIMPEHIWAPMVTVDAGTGDNVYDDLTAYANPDPVGSGPFTLREMEADSYIIYDARSDYWGGPGEVDVVIKRYYGTTEAQLLALKTGEIDATATLNINTAVPQLLAEDDIDIYQYQVNNTMTWYANLRHEPWNLTSFRKAVSIGLDRNSLVNFGADGWATAPNLIQVAPFLDHAADDIEWPYYDTAQEDRLEMANDALDAIEGISDMPATPGEGWTRTYDGTPLEFELLCTTGANYLSCAEIIAENCADMGIKLNVSSVSASSLVGSVYRQSTVDTAEGWETHLWSRPFSVEYDWLCDNYKHNDPADPTLNTRSWIIGWEDETIQDKLAQIPLLVEGDATRDALVEETQQLLADEEIVFCLYHIVTPNAYRTDKFTGQIEGPGLSAYGAIPGPMCPQWILALEPV